MQKYFVQSKLQVYDKYDTGYTLFYHVAVKPRDVF